MTKVLIITGPTATGKTALAVSLAKHFNGELVSADSRQVYIGMDIVTGKDRSEIGDTPIWMIDVVRPDEPYSVSHYASQANSVIADIQKRGKLPIVVGGTGLYIQALIQGIDTLGIPPDMKMRKRLESATVRELQDMIDPSILGAMNVSDRNNPRRLVRKIEIAKAGVLRTTRKRYDVCFIGLTLPRDLLYQRIDDRVDMRMRAGAKEEVDTLVSQGYARNLPAMQTLGIREWEHAVSEKEAITQWKYDEHAYARRQMTWFKRQKDIRWFDSTKETLVSEVEKVVHQWYT